MRTIVAIDPGSRLTGIAIIQGPRVWTMVMRSQTTAEIDAFVLACIATFGVDVEFVLEDQYLAEHKDPNAPKDRGKVNWPSIVKLVAARVRWQTIAELRGVKVWLANTGSWQGKMHAPVPKRDPVTGKERTRKQRSKLVVERTWLNVPRIEAPDDVVTPHRVAARASTKATHDEADAACIGRFHQLYGANLVVPTKPKPVSAPKPIAAPKRPRAPRKRKVDLEVTA